jgi:isopentenyl-diphosphate delta-isomerase
MQDFVILVDEQDNPIGTAEKMEAHQNGGKLHRAFSVLVFNDKGETMLQRRAASKYHCPTLRTNTCCSHPRPDEITLAAATRRLQEEMGFVCPLEEKFTFLYRAEFSNGLTEHEFDHVFV